MNPLRLANKNAIVTGGGQGMGRAIAHRFAAEGAEIMLIGRRGTPLDETAAAIQQEGGCAWAHPADVSEIDQVRGIVDAALARWGHIDILVNNAGVAGEESPFLDTTEALWDGVLGTNLRGVFLLSQRVAQEMVKTDGGVILHNASIAASAVDGFYSSYSVSKSGLLALNRSMAVELAPYNVRVNAVSPGYTHTVMTEESVAPEVMDYMLHSFERVPMRRLVKPEEVAAAFAFLASNDASAITGTNLVVDCGLTADLYILDTLPGS
jgi:NAD(P)-dependent dehydrogenase (short-subunit alcohol dehydrogenase family)